jgi:uncharacterized Zn finger protein (UPF0148 family)
LFLKWDGVFCPCCGSRLRIGPRKVEDKAKVRKQKKIQERKEKRILFYPYSLEEEERSCTTPITQN